MAFFRNWRSSLPWRRDFPSDRSPALDTKRDEGSSVSQTYIAPNRGRTFILETESDGRLHSNSSATEIKSLKKSQLSGKFNTFTKRKKPPLASAPPPAEHADEVGPVANVENTYDECSIDRCESFAQDANTTTRKLVLEKKSDQTSSAEVSIKETVSLTTCHFDASKYQKNPMPNAVKQQLEQLEKTSSSAGKSYNFPKYLIEKETDRSNKYKTVTINNFRKSFRDRYLQDDKRAPYNPSWFVEVQQTEKSIPKKRNDFNDKCKGESHALVQDENGRTIPPNQSSVKRNNTFKVQRPYGSQTARSTPDILKNTSHVEYKNSIIPNCPGRVIPVGVAKPISSAYSNDGGKKPMTNRRIFTARLSNDLSMRNYATAAGTSERNHVTFSTNSRVRSVPTTQNLRSCPSQSLATVARNDQRTEQHFSSRYTSPSLSSTTYNNRFTATTNISRLPKQTHSSGVVSSSLIPRSSQRKYGVAPSGQYQYDSYNKHAMVPRARSNEINTTARNKRNQVASTKSSSAMSARSRLDSLSKISWR